MFVGPTQFAITYCCLNSNSVQRLSKERVDSEFNSISLKKHDGPWTCVISFNLLFSTNIILEIDRQLLPPACYYASAMPVSIRPSTARVCNNVHKSDKR